MKVQITAPAVLAYTQKRIKEMKWPDFKYTGVIDGKAGFLNSSPNPEAVQKGAFFCHSSEGGNLLTY